MSMHAFIVAGEASGDLLGAELVTQWLTCHPNTKFRGMAGPKMRQAGVKSLVDAETMSIVGIWEVIKSLRKITRVMRKCQLALLEHKPDVLILIDYPGFNLRLAQFAHKHGIKVFYYVSPQIWAWRPGRIETIRQCVDHMAVLFQFEKAIYQQAGVPVTVVGHPLRKLVPDNLNQRRCRQQLKLTGSPVIGLMPGSREQEVQRLLPPMLAACQQLQQHYPHAEFVLPIADSLNPSLFHGLPQNITLVPNNTYSAIKSCDAVICASGTATLEVALLQVPMVLIYQVGAFNYWLGKRLIKTPYIGLCNIIAQAQVCHELIQHEATPIAICCAIQRCIDDKHYRLQQLQQMQLTRGRLGEGTANQALTKALKSTVIA